MGVPGLFLFRVRYSSESDVPALVKVLVRASELVEAGAKPVVEGVVVMWAEEAEVFWCALIRGCLRK